MVMTHFTKRVRATSAALTISKLGGRFRAITATEYDNDDWELGEGDRFLKRWGGDHAWYLQRAKSVRKEDDALHVECYPIKGDRGAATMMLTDKTYFVGGLADKHPPPTAWLLLEDLGTDFEASVDEDDSDEEEEEEGEVDQPQDEQAAGDAPDAEKVQELLTKMEEMAQKLKLREDDIAKQGVQLEDVTSRLKEAERLRQEQDELVAALKAQQADLEKKLGDCITTEELDKRLADQIKNLMAKDGGDEQQEAAKARRGGGGKKSGGGFGDGSKKRSRGSGGGDGAPAAAAAAAAAAPTTAPTPAGDRGAKRPRGAEQPQTAEELFKQLEEKAAGKRVSREARDLLASVFM